MAQRPTMVVVDHELSPSQLRNLEKATGVQVLDRTGVIVDIFHRHARSHEARMQVEIARLNYFATLDTTVRALQPESRPRVLVSDTVGFIQKLPHDLVASFRSTLDEALEASLLLYVVDASDPTWDTQLEVTRTVLREIGADAVRPEPAALQQGGPAG